MSRNSAFNSSQQLAVDHGVGPALVLSGAGSGKTRVITHRVARLIKEGTAANRILCLTFTRKAAKEMHSRINNLIGETAQQAMITTFHAWGLLLLKRHAKSYLGLKNFTLYDENDRKEVLVNILRELNINFSGNLIRTYSEQLSNAKNYLQNPENCVGEIKPLYERYQRFLTNRKACDFDDLLLLPYEMFSKHPELLEKYQQKYNYILVDEYQDTNQAQYELLKFLAGGHQNLMVVGDDDQSIYSWRGARVENLLHFEQDFPNSKIIHLEMNYRSSKNIIQSANEIIHHNKTRMDKTLVPVHEQGEKIYVFEADDPYKEAERVVEQIQLKVFQHNLNYSDFAILYRAKHQSKPLKNALISSQIPYQAYGEINFFERKEIRDLISFAKLLVNPDDDLSFLRIINIPRRVREVTLNHLLKETHERSISVYQCIKLMERDSNLRLRIFKPAEWEKLAILIHFLESYQNPGAGLDNPGKECLVLFKEFITQVEFQSSITLANEADIVKERRNNNILYFYETLDKYLKKNPQGGLGGFLTYILIDMQEDDENELSMVNLLTIHASKGLEFPHVFIVGFEENLLPFFREGFPTSEEEERRLCYVALTRAQKTCTLSFCKRRKTLGGEVMNPPSRFLQEIKAENLIRDYGKFQEKPTPPSQGERDELRSKAFSKMRVLLDE